MPSSLGSPSDPSCKPIWIGYSLRSFCMGWRNTPTARAFACAWAQRVAVGSMREQTSFDFARRAAAPALTVHFAQTPFFAGLKAPDGVGRNGWRCL